MSLSDTIPVNVSNDLIRQARIVSFQYFLWAVLQLLVICGVVISCDF